MSDPTVQEEVAALRAFFPESWDVYLDLNGRPCAIHGPLKIIRLHADSTLENKIRWVAMYEGDLVCAYRPYKKSFDNPREPYWALGNYILQKRKFWNDLWVDSGLNNG